MADQKAESGESAPASQTTKKKPRKPGGKSAAFSNRQIIIFGGGLTLLCTLVMVAGGLLLFNAGVFGSLAAPTSVVAALPPTAADPPTATPLPAPTETPTLIPEPATTAAPSPTATMVVPPELINRDTINEIVGFVEQWRQLSLPEQLPLTFMTRDQLRDQWQDNSIDGETIAAIQTQQAFYRTMGLISPEVDLVQAAFESGTDILQGYYTPEDKVMVIIADSVNMFAEEKMTFAHEYTHALQDHHFDLQALMNREGTLDSLLAARSLPEGDARLVEQLFTNANIGQDQLDYAVYRYLFEDHPQLEGVSPALGALTYFPYTAGEYFVIYLFINSNYNWDQVNAAYQNPPISSEQILHPEKYLAGERPTPVDIPDLSPALGAGWREIDRNVLGEMGLLVWLIDKTSQEEATAGAAGWNGDTYSLWADEQDRNLLVERSMWESADEAREFMIAFTTLMNLREGRQTRADEGDTRLWIYDSGITMIEQRGQEILVIVAPDRASLDQTRALF